MKSTLVGNKIIGDSLYLRKNIENKLIQDKKMGR